MNDANGKCSHLLNKIEFKRVNETMRWERGKEKEVNEEEA